MLFHFTAHNFLFSFCCRRKVQNQGKENNKKSLSVLKMSKPSSADASKNLFNYTKPANNQKRNSAEDYYNDVQVEVQQFHETNPQSANISDNDEYQVRPNKSKFTHNVSFIAIVFVKEMATLCYLNYETFFKFQSYEIDDFHTNSAADFPSAINPKNNDTHTPSVSPQSNKTPKQVYFCNIQMCYINKDITFLMLL